MKSLLILCILFCILSAPTLAQSFEYSEDLNKDIKHLLPEGKIDFEIMNGISSSNRSQKIIEKFTKALIENKEWFNQQMKNIEGKEGEPVPYDKRMGITKEEYDYMVAKKFDIGIHSTGQLSLDVTYSKNSLHIIPSDTTDFKQITIDFTSKKATIDKITLDFHAPININATDNIFNSTWKGYGWRLEESSTDTMDLDNLEDLVLKVYSLTVGFIDSSKQVYIDIKAGEYNRGEKTVDFKYRLLSQ